MKKDDTVNTDDTTDDKKRHRQLKAAAMITGNAAVAANVSEVTILDAAADFSDGQ